MILALLFTYMTVINATAYYLFWKDKKQARHSRSRVPNNTLLLTSFLGGEVGGMLSMAINHHKTRKWKFRILMPLFVILHLSVAYAWLWANEII